jgi:Predicted Zn peptidase
MRPRNFTKQMAQEVLRKHWDRRVPVDPAALAVKMQAKVVGTDLGELSGKFTLTQAGPLIEFNATEPEVRQRFSIAHELGHFVLGHGSAFRDPAKNFSASHFDYNEVDANKFAAELLMPESAVAQFVRDDELYDLRALAKRFHVSEAAMKYRLKNLGWIK